MAIMAKTDACDVVLRISVSVCVCLYVHAVLQAHIYLYNSSHCVLLPE